MKHFLLPIILLFCLSLTAQNQAKLDSLNMELKKWESKTGIQADTNLYNVYYNIGKKFQNSNPDTAIYILNKSLVLAKQLRDKIKEAESMSQIGWCYSLKGDYTRAMEVFLQALQKLSEYPSNKNKIRKEKVVASILGNIGAVYSDQGAYEKALDYYFKSLEINEKIGNKNGQAATMGNIGLVYSDQGKYAKALEFYFYTLKINEEIGNKEYQIANLVNIGVVYADLSDFKKALRYYFEAMKISEEIRNKYDQGSILGNIGNIYGDLNEHAKALEYYSKALKIDEETGNVYGQASILGNIGIVYREQGDSALNAGNTAYSVDKYVKALGYCFKALKINEEIEDKDGQAINLGNIGVINIKQKKFEEAEKHIKQAILLGEELHIIYILEGFYNSLSELYTQTGRHKEALDAYKTHIIYRDSMFSEENQKAAVQKEMQFEYEKKAATDSIANAKANEIKNAQIAKQKAEIKAKRNQQYALYGGLTLVVLFAGFVYNRLKVTQKQKVIIEQKERETHAQKEIIEEKHKEITDSINYAERIQRSFLATQEMLDKYLGVTSSSPKNEGVSRSERGYFVFFRPKDVVSGDFYWAAELNNGNFAFTCADSTGHGVPGAIMSILNISSLEKSVEKDTEPHQILNTTRRIIIDRLKKDGSKEGGKDGMDCSLFVLNKDKSQLSFASANNPVFILRAVTSSSTEENTSHPVTSSSPKNEGVSRSNNTYEILEYKPDKMPVGKNDKENEPFTLHTLQLQKGDVIYTLTDGFADQFGGKQGKKYMIKNVKELLLSIAHLPMPEQEQKLAEEFAVWKGKNEQVDDVCVIGVRV